MCDCLPKCCVSIVYIYHVYKFEARLLFLYLPLKNMQICHVVTKRSLSHDCN